MSDHDRIFRKAFSFPSVVLSYLEAELPAELHDQMLPQSLVALPTSFIPENLTEAFSDMVFSVSLKDSSLLQIALLFEHKSYQPDCVHQQLLKYLSGIWETQLAERRTGSAKKPFHLVLPFVIYHGKTPWKHQEFHRCFGEVPQGLRQFIPQFAYHLTDLSQMDPQVINQRYKDLALRLLFRMFWASQREQEFQDRFAEIMEGIHELFQQTPTGELAKSIFYYLIRKSQMPRETLHQKIMFLPKPQYTTMMSTYDQIVEHGVQKGLLEGLEKGLEKGLLEGLEKGLDLTLTIYKLHKQGKQAEEIAKEVNLPVERVKSIIAQF